MPTRNVVITEQQSDLIEGLVASGRYQNASEVLRAGLARLEREEEELAALRARLHLGLEEYRRGDTVEGDGLDVMRGIIAEFSGKANAAE